MNRYFNLLPGYDDLHVIDLGNCTFLGEGRSGKVYLMPDGNVIKIFKDQEDCMRECSILSAVMGSRHFPRVFECSGNYIIREFVGGVCLIDYIRRHSMSRRLALNLINLIDDFRGLGFTRLDIRASHIFVQPDESVKVIDPRGHFTIKVTYPVLLLRKLKKLKVFHKFMDVVREVNPKLYSKWRKVK